MTWSIVARDERTGEIGIAVASRFFACGAAVPYVGANAAVATQAFVNPLWGVEGLARLKAGEAAQAVLEDFRARDGGQALRQSHMADSHGAFAAHTGDDCTPWCGHLIRSDHSVAGNMLAGPEVIEETSRTFAETQGPLANRLLAAMQAGEAAGGDKRGRQAAGLTIHRGQDYAHLSLRVDDHDDPLTELARLLEVAGERYLMVAETFPTADNFSGTTDRRHIDAAIAAAEDQRRAEGRPSASRATSTEA